PKREAKVGQIRKLPVFLLGILCALEGPGRRQFLNLRCRLMTTWFRNFAYPLLFLAVALSPALAADEKKPEPRTFEVETVKDLAYYDGKDADPKKHKLDLYLPKDHKDFPVLLFVHGGAWSTGDRNYFGVYAALGRFYAKHGLGTVVISYRLSPQ